MSVNLSNNVSGVKAFTLLSIIGLVTRGKGNGLKIALMNTFSLRKRKRNLEIIIRKNDIDKIGLSEMSE